MFIFKNSNFSEN
jgi:hypothetical protein